VKWAVKVPFEGGEMYVIDWDKDGNPYPVTHDTREKAERAASIWRKSRVVEVSESL